MAFPQTINLSNHSGGESSYALQAQEGQSSRRIDVTTTMALPRYLILRHQTQGPKTLLVDRHTVTINDSILLASGQAAVLAINVSMVVPRAPEVTPARIYDRLTNAIDLLCQGGFSALPDVAYVNALLRGES